MATLVRFASFWHCGQPAFPRVAFGERPILNAQGLPSGADGILLHRGNSQARSPKAFGITFARGRYRRQRPATGSGRVRWWCTPPPPGEDPVHPHQRVSMSFTIGCVELPKKVYRPAIRPAIRACGIPVESNACLPSTWGDRNLTRGIGEGEGNELYTIEARGRGCQRRNPARGVQRSRDHLQGRQEAGRLRRRWG